MEDEEDELALVAVEGTDPRGEETDESLCSVNRGRGAAAGEREPVPRRPGVTRPVGAAAGVRHARDIVRNARNSVGGREHAAPQDAFEIATRRREKSKKAGQSSKTESAEAN